MAPVVHGSHRLKGGRGEGGRTTTTQRAALLHAALSCWLHSRPHPFSFGDNLRSDITNPAFTTTQPQLAV